MLNRINGTKKARNFQRNPSEKKRRTFLSASYSNRICHSLRFNPSGLGSVLYARCIGPHIGGDESVLNAVLYALALNPINISGIVSAFAHRRRCRLRRCAITIFFDYVSNRETRSHSVPSTNVICNCVHIRKWINRVYGVLWVYGCVRKMRFACIRHRVLLFTFSFCWFIRFRVDRRTTGTRTVVVVVIIWSTHGQHSAHISVFPTECKTERLPQHSQLPSNTDHCTYVWITPFVIDYMHQHSTIDASAAMRYNYYFGCSILHFLVIIHTLCAGAATGGCGCVAVAVKPFHDNKMHTHTHTHWLTAPNSFEWISEECNGSITDNNPKTAHQWTNEIETNNNWIYSLPVFLCLSTIFSAFALSRSLSPFLPLDLALYFVSIFLFAFLYAAVFVSSFSSSFLWPCRLNAVLCVVHERFCFIALNLQRAFTRSSTFQFVFFFSVVWFHLAAVHNYFVAWRFANKTHFQRCCNSFLCSMTV